MSIRVTALFLLVAGLSIYAWKDWFFSLCGLIVLMAVIEHSSMPRSIMGIQGLNPWNVLFGIIFVAWLVWRSRCGYRWDMPAHINLLLLLYLGVILLGFVRLILDRSHLHAPIGALVSNELVNTVKWALPAVLLFDGCRTRRRLIAATVCLLVMYFSISVLVIKALPVEAAFRYTDAIHRTRLKLDRTLGYHSCDISPFLAGAFWSLLACLQLLPRRLLQLAAMLPAAVMAFGLALLGSRAGYAAWIGTGMIMCIVKWRKLLLIVPVLIILIPVVLPGPTERMLQGFGETSVTGEATVDSNQIVSGRLTAWSYVVQRIERSPLTGYGRLAMRRTGLTDLLEEQHGEAFAHPHNMYLETLLDNGIIGSLPILLFWFLMVVYSIRMFASKNRLYSAIGGLSLGLVLVQLIGGVGALRFYPRSSSLGVWVAMFLLLRVHVEESKQLVNARPADLYVTEVSRIYPHGSGPEPGRLGYARTYNT